MMKVCVVGASGKLGKYMVQHALDRGYTVVGVCRERSVEKLDAFKGRITVIPGATNDREVIKRAVAGCDGVLVVLAPMGVHQNASGTAQAVLDYADPCGRRERRARPRGPGDCRLQDAVCACAWRQQINFRSEVLDGAPPWV